MASLEQRNGNYRIVFRFAGHKYSRSLKTDDGKAAAGSLARLEDNLRRVELGTLTVPSDADVVTFLLSDGLTSQPQKVAKPATLSELIDRFFSSLPEGSLEESTLQGMRIHRGHLQKHLGHALKVNQLDFDRLQTYVGKRSREPGLRGKNVSATTI